jgi:putative ABC transport system permease protein
MSGPRDLARDVRDGLRSRPGRTALALAGTALGLFALALSLGVLRGLRTRSDRLAAELGAHAAALLAAPRPADAEPGRRLDRTRLDALRTAQPGPAWSGAHSRMLFLEPARTALRVVRTDHLLADARGWTMARGRFLDPEDIREGARHAVATAAAARAMNWNLGDMLLIEGGALRLVGILGEGEAPAEPAAGVVSRGEPAIIVPWTALRPADPGAAPDELDAIHLRAPDEAALHRALCAADRLLAAPDLATPGAAWITADTLLSGLRRWRTGVAWSAGSLAALCLLLGGTSLMNLLLSDVRQRLPEIGLRLALGGRPSDIALLFWAEAGLISLLAAAAALAAAHGVLRALASQTGMPFTLGGADHALLLGAATVFAAVFSFIPARLAARVSAAEALRND